ncbi:MAG TPA: YdcF family protein [Hyphomicrobiaceae bacterium]|nr:YdcF family protein [Hyphomicrobiaceae bacterium]
MFFVVAKVAWFLAQPSSLMVAAIIGGVLLTVTRWKRAGVRLALAGCALLFVCGLSPVGEMLIRPLENRFARPDLSAPGRAITGVIVLGGASDGRVVGRPDLAPLNEAAERMTEAVVLARRFPQARVVFSGGSGALIAREPPEAAAAGRLFTALGVDPARALLEDKSRDTYENALYTHRLLQPKPGERWLLITSAWHMPRAIGCFRQAGFAVDAWPVDYRTPRRLRLLPFPSLPEGLRRVDFAMREYAGLVVYRLTGRTGALFPAP